MDYVQVRRAALETLGRHPTQYGNFVHVFAQVAAELGFINATPGTIEPAEYRRFLTGEDHERLREVFWAFFVEGVVILGMDRNNETWPFFKVTEYGEHVISAGEVLPHDPDGYLDRLRTECAGLDDTTEMYVTESLQCFLRSNHLASAVMLGVASESLFLRLLDAFKQSMDPDRQSRFEQAIANRPVARQWSEFRRRFDPLVLSLPIELREDITTALDAIFAIIRTTRNESGHPTGRRVEREIMFANLQMFRVYAKRVSELIAHFNSP